MTRYLLKNIYLLRCICEDEPFFEGMFDMLECVTSSCDAHAVFVSKLYRGCVREYKKMHLQHSTLTVLNSATPSVTSTQIPYIFCSFEDRGELNGDEYFKKIKESLHVPNLYMLLEGLHLMCLAKLVLLTPDMVCEIGKIRHRRLWVRISVEFFPSCHPVFKSQQQVLSTYGGDLNSRNESVRRVGKIVSSDKRISKTSTCEIRDLFCTSKSFVFYLRHPSTMTCKTPGKCGFILKFKPEMNYEISLPYKFRVDLCMNQAEYPEGLHIHPELIKANHIHLVPMFSIGDKGQCYCFETFTWDDHGVKIYTNKNSNIRWKCGVSTFNPSRLVKMVSFVKL